MKNIIIAAIIVITTGLVGFSVVTRSTEQAVGKSKLGETKADLRRAVLKIDGMFCASCATGAEYALKEKDGVVTPALITTAPAEMWSTTRPKFPKVRLFRRLNPTRPLLPKIGRSNNSAKALFPFPAAPYQNNDRSVRLAVQKI
jgi:hypothetical protein